jgi:Ran GTPase-activating protein (RanGAP) involved in mRNA processing and transport
MHSNQFGDEAAIWIADMRKINLKLQEMYLSGNSIGDKGARFLAESINSSWLIKIFLGGNLIGDEGAKWIAEVIKKNTCLQSISFISRKVGVEGERTGLHKQSSKILRFR